MANIQEIIFSAMLLYNLCIGSSTTLPSVNLGGAVAEVQTESQLFYSRFPACRRGSEFAVVVREEEREEQGSVFYERVRADGKVKYYLCTQCTLCEDYGLATSSPCTDRANSECSTECLEPSCVFDIATSSCKLRNDDVSDATTSSHLCSSRRMLHATKIDSRRPQALEGKQSISDRDTEMETTKAAVAVTTKPSHEKLNEVTKGRLKISEESRITPSYVFTWTASDAVFVGAGIVIAVVLANAGAILYIQYYRKTRGKRSERERSRTTSSMEAFYTALARARTDSNVTNKSNEIAAV